LEQAESPAAVQHLVQTFVISQRMAEQLCDLVIPNLQFELPADNKGVLIVGNYGTGKSHLLSLIAGLAEYPDIAKVVRDKDVATAAQAIDGKFKVVRLELPATKKSLRNIIWFFRAFGDASFPRMQATQCNLSRGEIVDAYRGEDPRGGSGISGCPELLY